MRRPHLLFAALALLAVVVAGLGLRGGISGSGLPNPALAGGQGPATEAGITWRSGRVLATGPGRVGPWRMNRSDWRYVDDPTVGLAPGGDAAVAWVDQARKDILFQRFPATNGKAGPAEPVNVSRSPEVFSWLPRLVVAPEGRRIYMLWQEIVFSGGSHGGEAFFARSTDGGRTWSDPVNLSQTQAGAGKGRLTRQRWHNGSLDLALGPEGRIYATWTVYEGGLFLARSGDGGRSFAEPLRVSAAASEPARAPSLAVGPDGAVHLAWTVGGDPGADLRYATSTDGARSFTDPRVLFPGPRHADAPKLAAAGSGTLHLAFAEGPWGERSYRIRYARAPAGADGFGPAREVPALPREGYAGARFPYLALDAGGDPHLVWELYPEDRPRSRGLGYAGSADGGRSFPAPALIPGTDDPGYRVNGSLQGLLMAKLAVGSSGEVAVVNSAFEPGEASRIRLIRGRRGDP